MSHDLPPSSPPPEPTGVVPSPDVSRAARPSGVLPSYLVNPVTGKRWTRGEPPDETAADDAKTINDIEQTGAGLTILEAQEIAWRHSERSGFHEALELVNPNDVRRGNQMVLAEKLALIHSEVSEALEALRDGQPPSKTWFSAERPGKPEGFPSEVADIVIRCFDLAGVAGFDLEDIILAKMRFNLTRPPKHGRVF